MSGFLFTRLELTNWKNFQDVDVQLSKRVFLVGPNASGKSNLLDAFRFLREVAVHGLELAVRSRDGMSRLRSLYARTVSGVRVAVTLQNSKGMGWRYQLEFSQEEKTHAPKVVREVVECIEGDGRSRLVLDRPNAKDHSDPRQLSQTYLQQINANGDFRELADALGQVSYLHLVPQIVKERQPALASGDLADPFGRDLLDRIRKTPLRTQKARLKKIQEALNSVASPLEELDFHMDEDNRPRLRAKFNHWRPKGAYQYETQFSDGTLRLIGLLWSFQEKGGALLLEEPELGLHSALVRKLAPFIARAQRGKNSKQVILSTHSVDLLTDQGIAPEEIVLIQPDKDGSKAISAASIQAIKSLMECGIPASEAVMPRTEYSRLPLFDGLDL